MPFLEKHDNFNYPFQREADSDFMTDIHDGSVFRQLMVNGGLLSRHGNVGLILSSDGVPVFKSSKGSLWPVYFMITNIPPHQRTRMDNLIVAGLWFGPTKPNMDILFQPILKNVALVSTQKSAHIQTGVCLQPFVLMGVFDLPAKASATNTKQFNGEYGCFYCLDKGHIHNRARTYPPTDSHTLRTTEQMKAWALKANELNIPQYGVKGTSVLGEYIDFPQCVPIDYMHSILEGVFKQLMKFWFNSSFHSEPYSLRKYLSKINTIVAKIQPPNEIQRLSRSLNHIQFFKASEFRAWILFYALAILSMFLPPEYTNHLFLLVSSMHILLSDNIKISELDNVHQMLLSFYQAAGELYSPNIFTVNMHSLVHTVPLVKLWGPLWGYSMFGFENLNGYLGTTFHGTRIIVYQMTFQIQLAQTLPDKLRALADYESPETKAYIESVLDKKRMNMMKIDYGCYVVGQLSTHNCSAEEHSALTAIGITVPNQSDLNHFQRLMLNGTIYKSQSYSRSKCRNDTICCFRSDEGSISYGSIKGFFFVRTHTTILLNGSISYSRRFVTICKD